MLVGHVGSEVFAADDVPSFAKFVLDLSLYNSGHFAVFLSLEDSLKICHFFDCRVGDPNDGALLVWFHVRVADEDFLDIFFFVFRFFDVFRSWVVCVDFCHDYIT